MAKSYTKPCQENSYTYRLAPCIQRWEAPGTVKEIEAWIPTLQIGDDVTVEYEHQDWTGKWVTDIRKTKITSLGRHLAGTPLGTYSYRDLYMWKLATGKPAYRKKRDRIAKERGYWNPHENTRSWWRQS